MLDDNDIKSLIDSIEKDDNKLTYIKNKIERKGIEYLSLAELNYIRELNDLPKIEISKLKDLLYNYYISYSDIQKETGISRTMLCMVLRENRNCTIKKLKQLLEVINKINKNITLKDLVG
ncbi:MAG: hypothetical protein J6Y42_01200 [Bacilli bacterium]|nr:hypothetical protein [Bacilli bacterium]